MQDPGVSHITIEGDYDEGKKYLRRAYTTLQALQERLKLGGISSGGQFVPLEDGAYLYARVAMGLNAVQIVIPPEPLPLTEWEKRELSPPEFFSGFVSGGRLNKDKLLEKFFPDGRCATRYGLDRELATNAKLAIEPYQNIRANKNSDTTTYAQTGAIRATLYSGRMKEVVQLLLGYGRQIGEPMYEKKKWVIKVAGQEDGEIPISNYQREVASDGYQVRYDYRHATTHGIGFGSDGLPWLVEISGSNGVLAMPLPLHPETTKQEFQDWVREQGEQDLTRVLDDWGGFPSGESFYRGEALQAAIDGGVVLRLLEAQDLEPFYSKETYSSALGWAFNHSGTEAHNTCWEWQDNGWQKGFHYSINLSIGSRRISELPKGGDGLRKHLAPLRKHMNRQIFDVMMKKIDLLNDDDIKNLSGKSPQRAMADLQDMRPQPIASATANLSQVSGDWLTNVSGQKNDTPLQAKFWEPLFMNGCLVSHNFGPKPYPDAAPTKADGTMLVFFQGDALKWVKWHRNNRRPPNVQTTDDFDDCTLIGFWERITEMEPRGISPGFYTNDFDYREEIAASRDEYRKWGNLVGWAYAIYRDEIPNVEYSHAIRFKRFYYKTEDSKGVREGHASAFYWPGWAREAYGFCFRKIVSISTRIVVQGYYNYEDPWMVRAYRVWPWTGDKVPECGRPDVRRVFEVVNRGGGGCGDIVGEGPWASKCQDITSLTFNIPEPPVADPIQFFSDESKVTYKTHLVLGWMSTEINLRTENEGFFLPSPDENGNVQYASATGNVYGDAECTLYDEGPGGARRVVGAFQGNGVNLFLPTFVGVVDG